MHLRALALAALTTQASAWWQDEDTRTRGEAPYPYPATHSDGTAPAYKVRSQPGSTVAWPILRG
jgi:hypothetical protein